MVKPVIIEETPISMVKLKDELKSIKERDKELGGAGHKTEEYLNQFVILETKKAEELRKKLEELKITRLKNEFIIKITDLMPKTVDQLKVILQGYIISLGQEDMKRIVNVVNEFIPAKK